MKNLFFTLATVAILAVSLASCSKDRVCECTYEGGAKSVTTIKDVSKRTAKYAGCVSYTETEDGDTFTVDCEIK